MHWCRQHHPKVTEYNYNIMILIETKYAFSYGTLSLWIDAPLVYCLNQTCGPGFYFINIANKIAFQKGIQSHFYINYTTVFYDIKFKKQTAWAEHGPQKPFCMT